MTKCVDLIASYHLPVWGFEETILVFLCMSTDVQNADITLFSMVAQTVPSYSAVCLVQRVGPSGTREDSSPASPTYLRKLQVHRV